MADLDSTNLVIQQAAERIGSDVGALVGEHLDCKIVQGLVLPSADLAKQCRGKLVLARMTVSGDRSGEAFLLAGAKTAIAMGGRLIMLPAEELANRVNSQNFDGELADAFEEIANIVTGSLNTVFQEESPIKLHFKKVDVQLTTATEMQPALGESHYYLASGSSGAGGQDLGPIWLLFPPALLDLPIPEANSEAAKAAPGAAAEPGASPTGGKPLPVLIVAEVQDEGAKAVACLSQNNIPAQQLEIQADHRKALGEKEFGGVLLMTREVGELGFATTIKLRSAMKPATPLIIAGPEWTRKSVLQAIKYGASDILISPVSDQELLDKLREHLG
jgi:hypothetical protein